MSTPRLHDSGLWLTLVSGAKLQVSEAMWLVRSRTDICAQNCDAAGGQQFCEEPTALNSKRLPQNGKGAVRFLSFERVPNVKALSPI